MTTATEWEAKLGRDLLKSVSRSFYLTLKALPDAVRAPVSLAYLLARATDTVADTAEVPADRRGQTLDEMKRGIAEGSRLDGDILPYLDAAEKDGEKELLRRWEECLAWLAALPERQQEHVRGVLKPITRGQRLDVERFPGAGAGEVRALPDAAATEDYAYCVAGSVGEFWTLICRDEIGAECFDENETIEKRCQQGISLGKGLQLVNILRDLPRDWERGRCYLPLNEIERRGGSLSEAPQRSEALRLTSEAWEERCEAFVDEGLSYVVAIRNKRLRFATSLPLLFAIRTLRLVQETPWEERWRTPVKMDRAEVKRIMARATLACLSAKKIEALYRELGKR